MMHTAPADVPRPRGHGFTLIELVAVIVVVCVMAGVLLKSVVYYQEQAEKTAMEQTIGIMRSALHLQIASMVAKGRMQDIPKLAQQNPMSWLAEKPKNYGGEYYALAPEDVVSGNWYFDLREGNLIYFPRSTTYLRTIEGQRNQIRFHVKLVTDVASSDKETESAIRGVVLEQVFPYTWF
jgi:general secretion pathway protein G